MSWAHVARILGHRDAANTIKGVDEDERGTTIVSTPGGEQTLSTISEAGLVTVLMRARVEAATPFRRWVTHEAVPTMSRLPQPVETPDDPVQRLQRMFDYALRRRLS